MKNKLISLALVLLLVITALPLSVSSAEYQDGFAYEVVGTTATVTGYDGNATALTVPASLGGYTVTAIGSKAFDGNLIQSIALPATVTSVADDSFSSASIRSITVGSANETYSATSGVLYNKDKTTLVRYPAGKTSTTFSIPSTVTSVAAKAFKDVSATATINVSLSIQTIGESAFENAKSLKLNSLPTSLVTIGDSAFKNCAALTINTIPASLRTIGNNAFEGCTAITLFTMHNGVQTIGDEAFKGCTSLRGVIFPASVTSIGQDAFLQTSALEYFGVDTANTAYSVNSGVLYSIDGKTLIKYPDNKSDAVFTMPDTVEAVQNNAFAYTNNLITLNSGKEFRTITAGAFRNCDSVQLITIPQLVSSIDVTTFDGCTALRAINVDSLNPRFLSDGQGVLYNKSCTNLLKIPEGYPSTVYTPLGIVQTVDIYAAKNCTMLQKINLPSTVQTIGYGAFMNCPILASMTIPASTTTISERAFENCPKLETVTFNSAVETIESKAFYGCVALTSADLPASLKTIGISAFENSGLETVTLSEGLESVGESAFAYTLLTTVDLPATVASLGDKAFFNCSLLEAINVATANENYKSDDGVLYSTDGTLIQYPSAKASEKYIVLDGTEKIGNLALYGATALESIEIGRTVTDIASDSFSGITNSVTIHGYANTAAEQFATAHSIAFVAIEVQPTDIFVSAVSPVKTDTIYDGDEILFRCTLRNIGDYDAFDPIKVDFYFNGRLIESVTTTTTIAAGRSLNVTTTVPKVAFFGTSSITVIVNDDENLAETDFTNNRKKARFLIV